MASEKKGGKFKLIFVLLIITCVIIIGAFSWKMGRDNLYGDFENDKKSMAEVLYSDVLSVDLKEDYPKTPDEVMRFFGKCYKLIYGNMIRNDEILAEVVHVQRNVFSEELASTNTFEREFQEIKESISTLKDNRVYVIDFDTKPPVYDKEYNTCEIRTIISTNARDESGSSLKMYMLFNVVKDDNGFWRINSFRKTNSEFKEI